MHEIADNSIKPANTLEIARLGGFIGAEVRGIDFSVEQPESVYASILAALAEHGMLVFRNQRHLGIGDFVALGERFGELEDNETLDHVEGFPQVGTLIKEKGHQTSIGDMWHVDHTYLAEPMRFTMLRAIELPAFGGDTIFLSAKAGFASLPDGVKETLRGLKALHSRTHLIKDGKYAAQFFKERPPRDQGKSNNQMAIHPVVTTLPETGQEILFVNPGYVVKFDGWTAQASQGLLQTLYEHCLTPEYQFRLRWEPGTIAIWDNRQTWHFAVNDYAGQRREMQRLVIA